MSVLSAQSIRRLCCADRPLITPFVERGVVNGKSYGLSACTYDCRIAQDLVLEPGAAALASTLERFQIPDDVCGAVLDKSSWARVFVSHMTTHLDPGWRGHLTLEIINHGSEAAIFQQGDPVCQIKFEWLDEPTDRPYVAGKYMNQPNRPVSAIYEGVVPEKQEST